jgi:uncharacterized protein (DUF934 family)
MPLLKHRQIAIGDPWRSVADAEAVAEHADAVVTLARLLAEYSVLFARQGRLGVVLEPTDDVNALAPFAAKLALVNVNFPKFGDGRGYTKARLLRERLQYRGELRAVGEVLGDQLLYLSRCGFDAFELLEGKSVELALKCLDDFSVSYQPATDQPLPLYRRAVRGQAHG